MTERLRLDHLRPPANPPALESAWAAARSELQRPPRSWRRDLAKLGTAWLGTGLAVVALLGVLGQWGVPHLTTRAETLAFLLVVQVLGVWAALAPSARRAQLASVLASLGSMVAIVALRGPGMPGLLPQWICTLSHVGVDLLPTIGALLALRRAAVTPLRTMAVGLAVGAPGALVGEVGCGQGALHVGVFHLAAWCLAFVVVVAVGRRLRPDSYAP